MVNFLIHRAAGDTFPLANSAGVAISFGTRIEISVLKCSISYFVCVLVRFSPSLKLHIKRHEDITILIQDCQMEITMLNIRMGSDTGGKAAIERLLRLMDLQLSRH